MEAAEAIGLAFAALLAERTIPLDVAVGRDNRPNGVGLRDALVAGLVAAGARVVDIGVVPTPLLYWSLHHLPVSAGIQITGSHNPPEFNGFKLCVGTASLYGDGIQRLRAIIEGGEHPSGAGSVRHEAVISRYEDDIAGRIRKLSRPLKVVFDCGNGVGALVAPRLFPRLGIDAGPAVRGERRDFPEPPSRPDRGREPPRSDRHGAPRGRRPGHRLRRRRRSHRHRGPARHDHLGRLPAHHLRARRARAHGAEARPADHLRREVLAGAPRRDRGRGRRAR